MSAEACPAIAIGQLMKRTYGELWQYTHVVVVEPIRSKYKIITGDVLEYLPACTTRDAI